MRAALVRLVTGMRNFGAKIGVGRRLRERKNILMLSYNEIRFIVG